jgi:hypothetical protein
MPWPNLFGCGCCSGGAPVYPIATIPNCFCTEIPQTFSMTSSDHSADFSTFQDATIQWGPTPSWAAPLNLGDHVFLSTASFPDSVAGGALFYYHVTCQFNQVALTRIYQTSPYGSPYRDAMLYSWLADGPGNSCGVGGAGFAMASGSPFSGSDPVTVTFLGPT